MNCNLNLIFYNNHLKLRNNKERSINYRKSRRYSQGKFLPLLIFNNIIQ